MSSTNDSKQNLIFTYGTLKRGFGNHHLMQDLINQNIAVCLGHYLTVKPYPLVCGPYGIPYLINIVGSGQQVRGELYSVSDLGLARMDELERTSVGHYERLPIQVTADKVVNGEADGGDLIEAECYFVDKRFGERLWIRKGKVGMREYTEREGKEYVKRVDRPLDCNILDDLWMFVSSND